MDEGGGWHISVGSGANDASDCGLALTGPHAKRANVREELEQFHWLCIFTEGAAGSGPVLTRLPVKRANVLEALGQIKRDCVSSIVRVVFCNWYLSSSSHCLANAR